MTDNEIIKALKCCWRNANHIQCTGDCPMYEYCESDEEDEMNICGLALNLINRQRAEIERLKHHCFGIQNELEAYKDTFNTAIDEAKSEAIKEFVSALKERVVRKFEYIDTRVFKEVDNLVKEMTEGKENA